MPAEPNSVPIVAVERGPAEGGQVKVCRIPRVLPTACRSAPRSSSTPSLRASGTTFVMRAFGTTPLFEPV